MADHWLAHGAERGRQLLDDFAFGDTQLVVPRAVVLGDQVGVLELIATLAAGIFKADGEGRQILYADFAQQAHQHARIHTARQQHADIHRRALANRHGFAGAVEHAVGPVFQGQVFFIVMGAVGQGPPGFLLGLTVGLDPHPGGRRQLFDARQQGARCRHHGVEIQVVIERHRVEDRVDIAALEQRRQRRGKAQALAGARQVQRLDAQAVAGDEQALAVALPDGKGKHAVELGQQGFAPGVVALEQHFGVAAGIEGVAQGFKLGAQFREVVDRAVERQGQAQLRVDHRLG